jgi:3-hydroxybutyryl-CoA dehydrogenase
MSDLESVGVVGGGLMGAGIAQVAALAGLVTTVRELDASLCERARAGIVRSLEKGMQRGKLGPAERDSALGRLRFVTEIEALSGCGIIIEAIVEELEAKRALWRQVDAVVAPDALLASNTSSLSIVEQAVATSHPERFVGLHFFNPVPVMPLVEVVRTVTTSEATVQRALAFTRRLGKTPIVARDTPGFVVNLLLVPYMLDAVRAVERGVASTADIDEGMRLGAGHPMGPLALCDYVGLDTLVRVAEIMYEAYREPRHAPPPLLRRMVTAGMLGRKSGRGFYDYAGDPPSPNALTG